MNEVFKFNEDVVAKEVVDYIGSTYHAHYAGKEGLQTMDYLLSLGLAKDFCRASAIKYLSRFGKKQGQEKLDLLKKQRLSVKNTIFRRNHDFFGKKVVTFRTNNDIFEKIELFRKESRLFITNQDLA